MCKQKVTEIHIIPDSLKKIYVIHDPLADVIHDSLTEIGIVSMDKYGMKDKLI